MPLEDSETVSGLPLDNTNAKIIVVEFRPNSEIPGPGVIYFAPTVQLPDGQEPRTEFYSVGQGWEPADKGQRLIPENNAEKRKVSSNSNFGKFLDAVTNCAGAAEALSGSALEAKTWVGTEWHFDMIKFKVMNPQTKEEKERSLPVPTKFIGIDAATSNGKTASKPSAKSGASKAAAAKAKAALDSELVAELTELAAGKTHDEFMNVAFDLPAVESSGDAQNAVMASGPGSIWHAANQQEPADAS